MERSVSKHPNEFDLKLWLMSLSAKGAVAFLLTIPVSLVLMAVAYRIATGSW
jgi:hypothetical protein